MPSEHFSPSAGLRDIVARVYGADAVPKAFAQSRSHLNAYPEFGSLLQHWKTHGDGTAEGLLKMAKNGLDNVNGDGGSIEPIQAIQIPSLIHALSQRVRKNGPLENRRAREKLSDLYLHSIGLGVRGRVQNVVQHETVTA